MSKHQRRLGRAPKRYESEGGFKEPKTKVEVEEVYPSKEKSRRNTLVDKSRINRCTYFKPSLTDFGQLTEVDVPSDNYRKLLQEQYGFEPSLPEAIQELQELKKVLCHNANKVENSSQYAEPLSESQIHVNIVVDPPQEVHWQQVDNATDLDRYINNLKDAEVQSDAKKPSDSTKQTHIRISDVPRVKVIAEKFMKFKKNDIELRKLEEKVVCLEYDVFDEDADDVKPFQKMRAFFTIKPKNNRNDANDNLSPAIRRNFNIEDADLENLQKKEIEIIDGKIADNRSLLEDLKKVLRRKQAIQHKKKQTSLDLMGLYEMAKRESPPLDEDFSNANMLSKAELQEIKDLILKKCVSSVHGIRRRTLKVSEQFGDSTNNEACIISDSLVMELMREAEKDASI